MFSIGECEGVPVFTSSHWLDLLKCFEAISLIEAAWML